MQRVWKPLGFVEQLIETNWRGYACLVHLSAALKNLLSDLASYLLALMFLTSLLAILPD